MAQITSQTLHEWGIPEKYSFLKVVRLPLVHGWVHFQQYTIDKDFGYINFYSTNSCFIGLRIEILTESLKDLIIIRNYPLTELKKLIEKDQKMRKDVI